MHTVARDGVLGGGVWGEGPRKDSVARLTFGIDGRIRYVVISMDHTAEESRQHQIWEEYTGLN